MAIQLKSQHVTNMYTPIELITTQADYFRGGGGSGVTDHGYLVGLGDNDHPQYFATSQSSVFNTLTANMSNYQLTANNSLSLGTGASVSFVHTSNSTNFVAYTNSSLFALTNHTHTGLGGAVSDHSHGSVYTANITGTDVTVGSASNGLTLGIPQYITTAFGGAIQGSGSYSQNTGTIQFSNANGVTFGLSDDGVMTASVAAVGGAQTGISAIHVSGGTLTEGTLHLSNSNGISFGLNSNTLTAQYTVPGVTVFSNSNNIEFGLSGSTITALGNFAQTTQTQNLHNITLSGNTAGTMTQVSSGTLTLAGGSNITLSQSGNKISIIGAQGGNYVNIGGNTSGTTAEISSGTMTIAGGNNITLSQNGNAITISGAAQGGVQTGISGIGVSNTVYTSGTVIWSAANTNVVLSSFVTSDSQYVRVSVPNFLVTAAQSDHTHGSNISFGNTTNSTESVVRASSSSNGLTMVIPKYITTAALSQNTSNYAGISTGSQSTAGTDIKVTLNTSGLNIGMPKYVTNIGDHTHGSNVALSLTNVSGAASSASNGLTISLTGYPATSFLNMSDVGSLYFGGGSNITWDSSVDGVSTSIMATAGGGSGAAGIAMAFSGNTTGTTAVIQTGTLRLVGGNNITLSQAGSIVTISAGASGGAQDWVTSAMSGTAISIGTGSTNTLHVPAYITTATGLVNTGFTTTATAGSIVLGTLNSLGLKLAVPAYITAGGAGGQVTFSAGVSSAALTNVVFSNANNVSFGLNGSTMTAQAATGLVSYVDGGGISWGTSSGSASQVTNITASVNSTQYAGQGTTTGTTSGNSLKLTVNSAGVNISHPAWITAAGAVNWSVATQTATLINISTGSTNTLYQPVGNIYFQDSNGHSFSSSVSGVSTTIYIVT